MAACERIFKLLDTAPDMIGAPYTYAAYAMGFMKSALIRAQNEPKHRYP